MLTEVRDLQNRAVSEIFSLLSKSKLKEITFKSPTGSGKTYMMADLMNRVLQNDSNVVFLVSSLSTSGLAEQDYNKFSEYMETGAFPYLKPYLISTEISGEERLFIPPDYNVYVLPRDLYKKNGKLMRGSMDDFLQNITGSVFATSGMQKKIYLVKDECHQATNNLDEIKRYFAKTINFSATPKQHPDVEITEEEAEHANLIKTVEFGSLDDDVEVAVDKFKGIREQYRDLLGVNPCLIIQISNKDKGADELENKIKAVLGKTENQDLKWMLILNNPKDFDTNDIFKVKKLPPAKWKDYAKENASTIDVIIFKMVIKEGWDIPRACMLYQLRDSDSKQMDEQVMGRVRRNPRLLDFETLSPEAKELATKAWVWGIVADNAKQVRAVKLYDEPEDITKALKLHTTRLKQLKEKADFNLSQFIDQQPEIREFDDIFTIYRRLEKSGNDIQDMCYAYANNDISKWWRFNELINKISAENDKFVCDYSQSMELVKDESGKEIEVSLPVESAYYDNGSRGLQIDDWVWIRKDGQQRFVFDSDAEHEWADLLRNLAKEDASDDEHRVAMRVKVGKRNPKAGMTNLAGEVEPDKIDEAKKYLWGKNFLKNSEVKFEYCFGGVHLSYPDFIFKDCYGRVHIFEVKSVNKAASAYIDSDEYKQKLNALIACYKQASLLTGYIFYVPVLKNEKWNITRLYNGEASEISEDQFKDFVKKKPNIGADVKVNGNN